MSLVGAWFVCTGCDTMPSDLEDHCAKKRLGRIILGSLVPHRLHPGVAILRYAKLSNGQFLAKGKTITGFANVEEDFADNAVWEMNALSRDKHIMPWRIEDEMKKLGANYVQAGMWRGFAIRDGNLITGQQNFSGEETARLVVDTLGR